MKKLYTNKKGKVHPSPPPIADHLSLLPATILTLTVALSPQDKEVLAYLISCSGTTTTTTNFSGNPKTRLDGGGSGGDHPTQFNCNCFRCYMSYWVRWDASPNRQLIHEVLDAYEDGLFQKKKKSLKKERRKRVCEDENRDSGELGSVEVSQSRPSHGGGDVEEDGVGEVGSEKGSVRKLVSFIGERIWGVWGI
ncbi:hypothetical protein HYC85_011953 [Camellia sinensis]|uniref:Uncharacterized protein n=1 Tax=Camellia sinensis TaxID=4442 RepID=A0A7J7HAK1_CAMSI|nr:hypothetical protein HYC85_011953 [Camellia sinensis]